MIHTDHRARMRERFMRSGLEGFAPHEALELLLYYTIPRRDTNAIAHALLQHFGSLSAVLEAHPAELMQVEGIGQNTAVFLTMLPQLWRMYRKDSTSQRAALHTSGLAGLFAVDRFVGKRREELLLFTLDSACRLIREHVLYQGSLTEVSVQTRTIVETVLRDGASQIILAHNHPNGALTPSQADTETTRHIVMALATINVNVLDHIIVCGEAYASMANMGMMATLQKDAQTRLNSLPLPAVSAALQQPAVVYTYENMAE